MIKFDSQYHLYDVTPIENMFIQQYLVKSPGDYVKVYIFCLNLCYYPDGNNITMDYISSALKLDKAEIERAFRYWSRLGIMSVDVNDNSVDIEMHSIKDMFLNNDYSNDVDLYKYSEFNNAIAEAFSPRILDTQDYLLYQDMINIFNVSQEYVIEAVKYSIKTSKSTDIPYKYVEKVIEAWKNDNISDVTSLKKYLEKKNSTYAEITNILRYLGMNRAPTVPELNCYKKWTEVYNFSFDSIKEACNLTLSANTPTIKYLDSILTGLYEKKVSTPSEISNEKENTENYRSKVRKILYYMGIQGAPSQIHIQKYKKWETAYGYSEEDITIAASMISDSKNPYDALDNMLESFFMQGVKNADDMLEIMQKREKEDSLIKQIHTSLGKPAEIMQKEREFTRIWKNDFSMPDDVIIFAAGCAKTADKPWQYMNRILTVWHDAKISTVAEAQIQNNAKFTANVTVNYNNSSKSEKKYSFADIDNHKYSDEDFDSMFDDFGGESNA